MVEYHIVRFLEDLRYVLMLASHMVKFLENLGKSQLGGYLGQIVELRESPPLGCQMVELR